MQKTAGGDFLQHEKKVEAFQGKIYCHFLFEILGEVGSGIGSQANT